jgi:hypothetical protein
MALAGFEPPVPASKQPQRNNDASNTSQVITTVSPPENTEISVVLKVTLTKLCTIRCSAILWREKHVLICEKCGETTVFCKN